MYPLTGLLALGLLAIVVYYRVVARKLPLPPGPPGELISGNVKELIGHRWLVYAKWAASYGEEPNRICVTSSTHWVFLGPIISYRVYHQRVVVLNSAKAAVDLLESKAAIYSDRPIVSDVMILLVRDMCSRFIGDCAVVDGSTPHRPYKRCSQRLSSQPSPQKVQEETPLWPEQPRHTNVSTDHRPRNLRIFEETCHHA